MGAEDQSIHGEESTLRKTGIKSSSFSETEAHRIGRVDGDDNRKINLHYSFKSVLGHDVRGEGR